MRHGKRFNHLSRTSAHRKAMLANMASSLIIHKRIKTTTAKAKALRVYIEPLITKSKTDSTHSRRLVFSHLNDKEAVTELFREVSVKIGDRPGGYTRIIKIGPRMGDNAEMAIIELVDYNENLLGTKAAAKKTRRRRGGAKKQEADAAVSDQVVENTTEKPVEEVVEEKPEVKEEVKTEEPKAEAKKEEPKAEVKEEEPKAEAKKEEPKAEVKEEEPKAEAEAKVEEPKDEVKEEKKEEPKENEKKKDEKK
jgi:large subunit ribosomal protein L17